MKGLVAGSKGGLMGALGAMGKQKTVRHSITRSISCGYPYFTSGSCMTLFGETFSCFKLHTFFFNDDPLTCSLRSGLLLLPQLATLILPYYSCIVILCREWTYMPHTVNFLILPCFFAFYNSLLVF